MYKLPLDIVQHVDQYQPISELSDGTERSVAYYRHARQDIPKDVLIYQLNMQGTNIFFAFTIEANEIITEINIFFKLIHPNEDMMLVTSNQSNLKDVLEIVTMTTNREQMFGSEHLFIYPDQLTLYYDSFYFTWGVADISDILIECFKLLHQLASINAYWMPSTYHMLGSEPNLLSDAVLLP